MLWGGAACEGREGTDEVMEEEETEDGAVAEERFCCTAFSVYCCNSSFVTCTSRGGAPGT